MFQQTSKVHDLQLLCREVIHKFFFTNFASTVRFDNLVVTKTLVAFDHG